MQPGISIPVPSDDEFWHGAVVDGRSIIKRVKQERFKSLFLRVRASLAGSSPWRAPVKLNELSLFVTAMVQARSMDVDHIVRVMPSEFGGQATCRSWISRFLGDNRDLKTAAIIEPFCRDALAEAGSTGDPVVLVLEQMPITKRHHALILGLRCDDRVLPLLWQVNDKATPFRFDDYRLLLEKVADWLHVWTSVVLIGDQVEGSAKLVDWCQDRGWDYSLNLPTAFDVVLPGRKGTATARKYFRKNQEHYKGVQLPGSAVRTNLNAIRGGGEEKLRLIAVSERPVYLDSTVMDSMIAGFVGQKSGNLFSLVRKREKINVLMLIAVLAIHININEFFHVRMPASDQDAEGVQHVSADISGVSAVLGKSTLASLADPDLGFVPGRQ